MAEYANLCEARGRAKEGKGCTALSNAPEYCLKRSLKQTSCVTLPLEILPPIPDGTPTPTPTPSFTPIADPLIAGLGGSRIRQSGVGINPIAHSITGGALTWLKFLDDRIKFTNWYTSSGANSNFLNGMLFADDGEGFVNMYNRAVKMIASDANICYMDLSSNSVQDSMDDLLGNSLGTMTVANYTTVAKQLVNSIRAARPDMLVIVSSLVERTTAAGGVWAVGGKRTLVPGVNADMQAWCAGQTGVVYADIRSVITNLSDPNFEPLAGMTRDGTHWSPRGAYAAAQVVKAAIAPYIAATQRGSYAIEANVLPAFAGAGGVLTGTALTGIVPTGWTLSRFGATANAAVTSSVVTQNGKTWTRLLIDTTAMGSTDLEGFDLTPTNPATVVSGGWYVGSAYVDAKAHDAWALTGTIAINNATGLAGQNGGGTPITGTGGWTGTLLFMPSTAFQGRVETFSGQTSGTAASPYNRIMLRKGSGGVVEILIAEPELRRVSDPNLIMYNEADTTPIIVTSSLNLTVAEGDVFTQQVTTNKSGANYTLTGNDAAFFTISRWGVLKATAVFDFENPGDTGGDNVYDVTVNAASFNLNAGTIAAAHTVTVTDANDGFADNFNRANEELSASSNWEKAVVGTGTITVSGNRLAQVGGTTSMYLAPAQGADAQQRITWSSSMGGSASTSNSPIYRITRVGSDNTNSASLRHTPAANVMDLIVSIGGTTTVYTVNCYTNVVNGTKMMAQYLNDAIEVYQNDVLIHRQVVGANVFGAGVGRSGISCGASNITAIADAWNNRVAADFSAAAKIALKSLTITPTTGTAGVDFAATITNKTVNSTIALTINSGPAGGSWIVDGFTLRGTDLVAGTYAMTLTESHPNAANNNRASSISVVVS